MTTKTTTKKGRSVKCPYCGNYLPKDESVEHNKRYYHKQCLDTKLKEQQHREEFYGYICEKFKINFPNGFMLKQIKEYKENLNYTYKGMELSLRYFFDIKENPITVDSLGIIPFVYEQAKEFYKINLYAKRHYNALQEKILTNKTIKIKSPLLNIKKNNNEIDIADL